MGEAIRAKVVAFVAELFQTHCDVSAAPETIDLYASAVLDGSLSVDAVAAQIRELAEIQIESTKQFDAKHGRLAPSPKSKPSEPIEPVYSVKAPTRPAPSLPMPTFRTSQPPSAPASLGHLSTQTPKPTSSPPATAPKSNPNQRTNDLGVAKNDAAPHASDPSEYSVLFESSFDPNPPGYAPKGATSPPVTTVVTPSAPQSKDGKMDPEVVKEYVTELYRVYAGKLPDPATFAWHVNSIVSGSYTLNQAEISIKMSKEAKEYQKQEAQKKAALKPKLEEYVKELMRVYVKRAPTEEELSYFVDKVVQGTANFQNIEDEIVSKMSLPSVPKVDNDL